MLREDYERFCRIFSEKMDSRFILQTLHADTGYAWAFGKVMLADTTWIELGAVDSKKKYNGIFVDVFPFDRIPQNFFSKKFCVMLRNL